MMIFRASAMIATRTMTSARITRFAHVRTQRLDQLDSDQHEQEASEHADDLVDVEQRER